MDNLGETASMPKGPKVTSDLGQAPPPKPSIERTPERKKSQPPQPPMADEPEEEPKENPYIPKDFKPQTAPQVDQATLIAMAATKMAEEALAKLTAVQVDQKTPGTPESVIKKSRHSDKAAIAKMPKVRVTIPGGYPGAPKEVTSCVNGHLVRIKTGKAVMVQTAHLENLERSYAQNVKNQETAEAAEQKTMKALGL
jgi:hypothetical protein